MTFVFLSVLLCSCASPTKTEISFAAKMPLAAGDSVVLFPGNPRGRGNFARCVREELTKRVAPHVMAMDTVAFQNALFPWFEFEYAPKTVEEMELLLSRPRVRERIASLNVRYVIDFSINTNDEGGFPGFMCGAGFGGGGCLGLSWQRDLSKLRAVVWDLRTGKKAGNVSGSSSGQTVAIGIVIPIVFIADTEGDTCKALAAKLAEALDGETKIEGRDQ